MTESTVEPQADTAVAEPEVAAAETATDYKAEAEKWKALARKQETRAKENAEKAKEYDAFKASQMTELEKAQKEAADAKAALEEALSLQKAAELAALRSRIAIEKNLPPVLINRLQGDDEESIAADADALLASLPKNDGPPPRVDIGQGDRGQAPAASNNPLETVLRTKLGI